MSTQTTRDFPSIQFIRMTRFEATGMDAMISDAKAKGLDLLAWQIGAAMGAEVMTLAQFDVLRAAYRHWLNWGFEPAPQAKTETAEGSK